MGLFGKPTRKLTMSGFVHRRQLSSVGGESGLISGELSDCKMPCSICKTVPNVGRIITDSGNCAIVGANCAPGLSISDMVPISKLLMSPEVWRTELKGDENEQF